MDDRLVSNGFIRLRVSKWESDNAYGGGIPQRELAITLPRWAPCDCNMKTYHYDNNGNRTGYSERETTILEWIVGFCVGFFGPIALLIFILSMFHH